MAEDLVLPQDLVDDLLRAPGGVVAVLGGGRPVELGERGEPRWLPEDGEVEREAVPAGPDRPARPTRGRGQ
jgi:hypothetical protein